MTSILASLYKKFNEEGDPFINNYYKTMLIGATAAITTTAVLTLVNYISPELFAIDQTPEERQARSTKLKLVSSAAFIAGVSVPMLINVEFRPASTTGIAFASFAGAGSMLVAEIVSRVSGVDLRFFQHRYGLILNIPLISVLTGLETKNSKFLIASTTSGIIVGIPEVRRLALSALAVNANP